METPVLLVSDGLVHPSLPGRFLLRRALMALPGYRLQRVPTLESLPHLPPSTFRAIVLYVHHTTLSPVALEALEGFLQAGGGLLAIHSASASFREEPRYIHILGGQFVDHGPVEEFVVQPDLPQDAVFGPMTSFTVRDELYRHDYDAANRIHFYTTVSGEREPVVWTRHQGKGRVCYCALGHTLGVMRHPHVRQILQRGLVWAATREET
jgi:type 1 glutamine amidotransferase